MKRKLLTMAALMTLMIGGVAAESVFPYEFPEGEINVQQDPAKITIGNAIEWDGQTAYELYIVESSDQWEYDSGDLENVNTGQRIDADQAVARTFMESEDYPKYEDTERDNVVAELELDANEDYWVGGRFTGYSFLTGVDTNFRLDYAIGDLEDTDDVQDGKFLDNTINSVANMLGIGTGFTRFLIGFFTSLGVGLAVGWSDEYGSTGFASLAFGLTFISLMVVGLVPVLYGITFTLIMIMAGWLAFKNGGGS